MAAVILAYHSIDDFGTRISVAPADFERQIRSLARWGYSAVTVSDLLARPRRGRCVAITFDDGFRSVSEYARDVLARVGFLATVFPIADALGTTIHWVDRDGPMPSLELMSGEELRTLVAAGWEVASHSNSHHCCFERSGERWAQEVRESRAVLTEETGSAIRGFAYPRGCHDTAAAEAIRQAGYAWACTTIPGSVHGSPHSHAIRRVVIARRMPRPRFTLARSAVFQALRRRDPEHRRAAAGRHTHPPVVQSTEFVRSRL